MIVPQVVKAKTNKKSSEDTQQGSRQHKQKTKAINKQLYTNTEAQMHTVFDTEVSASLFTALKSKIFVTP